MVEPDNGSTDRTNLFMFLGFVVLCVTVVLTVLIVNDDWPTERWVAIGAVAACVQAIGVTVALAYGAKQLRILNAQRRDPMFDRLDVLLYSELVPTAERTIKAWTRCTTMLELTRQSREQEPPEVSGNFVTITGGQYMKRTGLN